jgi:glycogen debranching enzyme
VATETEIARRAKELLLANRRSGFDAATGRRYAYSRPSRRKYPWQWFWDSCFHAIALTHLDVELAKEELRTLVSAQRPDGFIPHIVFWGAGRLLQPWTYFQSKLSLRPHTSELMQPPVLATAILAVFRRSEDAVFLSETLPAAKRYYRWLEDNRDPDGDGLISIISPYESGLDHKPAYEIVFGARGAGVVRSVLRRRLLDLAHIVRGHNYDLKRIFALDLFNVEDVLVNCVYARGLQALAELCVHAGERDEAKDFEARGERVEHAVFTKCYDEETGAYFDLYSRRERMAKTLTVTCLFPLILRGGDPQVIERLVREHLRNENEFWLPFPVPSVARCEPSFSPAGEALIWRGPTWINTNWFLAEGLARRGYHAEAARIVENSRQLVLASGFREFYDPFTGRGLGERDFGWSTLVVDM